MRISDSDRDKIASVLGDALAEGRLSGDEHSERLNAVYAAKTAADLAPLVADLPGSAQAMAEIAIAPPGPVAGRAEPASRMSWLVSVFSGTQKRGAWHVPRQMVSVNVFGGSDIDLREAVLPGREVSMRVVCVFGGASITIPPEMAVIDSGFALFGGRSTPPDEAAAARRDGTVLRIHSICVFGGVDITRKARKGEQAIRDSASADMAAQLPDVRARRLELRRELRSDRRSARRSERRRRPG